MKQILLIMSIVLNFSVFAKDQVTIAISSQPSNLNPFFSTDANSQNINRLVHTTLIDFDDKMKASCRACESFSESVNDKGQHIISFKLRDDLKFWDGTPVKANDVKKSWESFLNKEFTVGQNKKKSIFRFAFGNIEEVVVHDDYKVDLVYKKYNLDNLGNLPLFKIVKFNKDGKGQFEGLIGAGEYRYNKISPLEIELVSVDHIEKTNLLFKVVKDETTLALKLINGEVDLSVSDLSPRKYQWLKKNSKGLSFHDIPSTIYVYISFNHRNELLKDRRLRQALSLIIPREDILEYKLRETAVLSNGVFSPSFAEYYQNYQIDDYNMKKAEALMVEAGYKRNKDGRWTLNGKPVEFIWKVSSNRSAVEMVETIKGYYDKFGLSVKVVVQEWGTFMRGMKKGEFDLVLSQWIGFTSPEFLNYIFHEKSFPPKGANRGYYSNQAVNQLLDQGSIEANKRKRDIIFKEVANILNEDYAYINLWHPNVKWVARDCIEGVKVMPNASFIPLLNLKNKCEK